VIFSVFWEFWGCRVERVVGLSTSGSTEAAELPIIEASGLCGDETSPPQSGLCGDETSPPRNWYVAAKAQKKRLTNLPDFSDLEEPHIYRYWSNEMNCHFWSNEMNCHFWKIRRYLILLIIASGISAIGAKSARIIDYARSQIDVPYRWNGRNTTVHPDLDCMGLPFRAFARAYDEKWTQYSVIPSRLIQSGKLGRPIDSKAHRYSEELLEVLQPGDVIYFLVDYKAIQDEPIVADGASSWWVYHMGLISTKGKVIHASPWDMKVLEEDLSRFADSFRFYITRR
jgi:hypothetical protein